VASPSHKRARSCTAAGAVARAGADGASPNETGAAVTGIATAVFLFTKFAAGGWAVVVAVPLLVVGF
jgi:hypothetical protein